MEPSGTRTDNLDSTARLMSEALSKASTELEKLVTVFCDHLQVFNQDLDKSFKDEWRAVEDRMESRFRQTHDAITRDREDLVKKLEEFKQSEVQSVIDTGKEVRGRLAIKADETAAEFSQTLQAKVGELQDLLSGPQAAALAEYDNIRNSTATNGQDLVNSLSAKLTELQESIMTASAQLEAEAQQLVDARGVATDQHVTDAVEAMRQSHQQFAAQIEERQRTVPVELENRRMESAEGLGIEETRCLEKLRSTTAVGTDYAEHASEVFNTSMLELSTLTATLYDARLRNLLAQSRTEIVNSARKAENRIVSSKKDLQAMLKELQRDYIDKFEKMYIEFESSVEEAAKDGKGQAARGAKDGRAREQLNALFRRLGQEMIDTAASAAGRVETEFQRSVSTFEKRIESARDSACESLEREYKLMQKELGRTKYDFDKQLTELQNELKRIEKDGQDSADIVQTIRSASLEF